jgi:hypothetical protein
MTKLRWAGIGLGILLAGIAIAQVPATFNLTGNEIVRAALPGSGSDQAVPLYVMRSGENHTIVATSSTVSTTVPATAGIVLASGGITTWTVTLPTSPYTGQRVIINCPGTAGITTLTITATSPSGVAIVGTNPTSCTAGGTIAQGSAWTYSTTAKTWYRYE